MTDFDPNPPQDSDPTKQLVDYMAKFGLEPPNLIIHWDGRRHRFPGAGKRRGTDAWYLAYPDRMGAHFGDWSTGVKEHWVLKRDHRVSKAERARWDKEKRKRDREQAEARAQALDEVKKIWNAAEVPSPDKRPHTYLFRKEISDAPGLRISTLVKFPPTPDDPNPHIPAGLLLVPMYKAGKLINVQRVWPNGKKRWWPGAEVIGARILIKSGDNPNWDIVYITEGYATGWTVHQATGRPVVVAFTAGNLLSVATALRQKHPESKIIIAADNDRWKKITTAQGDIPNPGIYYAKKAAKAVGGKVVAPDFEDLAGRPTDFDDLRLRENLDAVRKYLKLKMFKEVRKVADPEPDDPDAEPGPGPLKKEETPDWRVTAPFRPLGHDHGTYYFASERSGQVRDLDEKDLSRSKALYSLAPKPWWKREFPQNTKPFFDVDEAGSAIIDACMEEGIFRTGRYRGRGVWCTESGLYVPHLGDRLLAPGADRYMAPERFRDADRIYPRLARLAGPAMKKPFTLDEAQRLLGLFEDLSWENAISGLLLAGFVVLCPFSGCLKYRPHCWLTGPTECGKSTIINEIVDPLLQCMGRIHREAHMTSEAALRQKLRGDALPVILDEADMVSPRAKANLKGLFDLARSASTGGIISKGTTGGSAVDYQVRSMFMFASIVVGLSLEQDKNRVAVLQLQSPKLIDPTKRREHWARLQREILELVTPYNGRRLMARTATWFRSGKFDELLKVTSRAAFHQMQSARAAELYGTLLAGAWTLKVDMDDLPSVEEVTEWMKDMNLGLDHVAEKAVQHSYECLAILMQERVPVSINHVRDSAPIGQLIDVVAGQTEDIGIKEKDAGQALRQRGIIIRDGCVCIATAGGKWIQNLYKDTPYEAGWLNVLKTIPDIIVPGREQNPIRFYPGLRSRVIMIPFKSLSISGF